jgi:hypothetical protein
MTPDPETLGDVLSRALQSDAAVAAAIAERARYETAGQLADDVAERLGTDRASVWDSLCKVPDGMLSLLDTPEGCTALAAYVAEDFGRVLATYAPTIH